VIGTSGRTVISTSGRIINTFGRRLGESDEYI